MKLSGVLLILLFMPCGIIPYVISKIILRCKDIGGDEERDLIPVISYFWPIVLLASILDWLVELMDRLGLFILSMNDKE